jgi:hypothetical protein
MPLASIMGKQMLNLKRRQESGQQSANSGRHTYFFFLVIFSGVNIQLSYNPGCWHYKNPSLSNFKGSIIFVTLQQCVECVDSFATALKL